MAIAFPRSDFLSIVTIEANTLPFRLMHRQEISRTAAGQSFAKDLGPALWSYELSTTPIPLRQALKVQAFLQSLDGLIGTLTLYDPTRQTPASDPTGSASLGSVTVTGISGNTITLGGLPIGFVLTPGDLLGVIVGGVPHLYEISESAIASGAGAASFEVAPQVRSTLTTGLSASLVRPVGLFKLSSWSASSQPGFMAFSLEGIEA